MRKILVLCLLLLSVFILLGCKQSENVNNNLEIKDGYYDTQFVETLMDDVEIFTEYLIEYMKLNGTDNGFEEWLIENDKPLYDKMMYYNDMYESRKK